MCWGPGLLTVQCTASLLQLVAEQASEDMIASSTKACPACGAKIMKVCQWFKHEGVFF